MTAVVPALGAIGWPHPGIAPDQVADPAWAEALTAHPQARPARVVEQHRTGYVVAEGPASTRAVDSPPEWARRRFPAQDRAAVGDWVLIEEATPRPRILQLLARRTAIKRGAAGEHYQQQLIAANIDTVFVVCGLDADFNPRRIERYLLLVRGAGGSAAPEPVVVLTKADRVSNGYRKTDEARAALPADVPCVSLNGLDAKTSRTFLRPWLPLSQLPACG